MLWALRNREIIVHVVYIFSVFGLVMLSGQYSAASEDDVTINRVPGFDLYDKVILIPASFISLIHTSSLPALSPTDSILSLSLRLNNIIIVHHDFLPN